MTNSALEIRGPRLWGAIVLCAILAGLSAPGFNQWYLAWCALAPFFYLVKKSELFSQAVVRGWLFGLVFHLVWMSWLLKINLPPWVGIKDAGQVLLAGLICWLLAGIIYGSTYAFSSAVLWLVHRFVAKKGLVSMVALIVDGAVFAAASLFICDKPDILLLPMAALEYSQYNNQVFLQVAGLIGGSGLQCILILVNMALSEVLDAWLVHQSEKPPPDYNFGTPGAPFIKKIPRGVAPVLFIVMVSMMYGNSVLSRKLPSADTDVSVLQCGFMLDVMRTGKGIPADEVLSRMKPMFEQCSPGLVVCTETSLPMSFDKNSPLLAELRNIAADRKLDIVFGIEEDSSSPGKRYNAATGVTSKGAFVDGIYRKQYLIPCGEFEPLLFRVIPPAVRKQLNLPAVPPYLPGQEPITLNFDDGNAAPLVCGENVEAVLCARSVKHNGNVITNISNLSWFQQSILGDQTIAMSAMRAVENNRYYVYAADTGPSFILDPTGKVTAKFDWCQRGVLKGRIRYLQDLTPFNLLCP